MNPLIRSAVLNGYYQLARSVGLDPAPLLASVGLNGRMLVDPDLRIPAASVGRLLERSASLSQAEDFGLRLAESRQLSNLGRLGLVVQQEPTLRRALEAMVRYLSLHNESLFVALEEADGVVTIRQTLNVGAARSMRQSLELAEEIALDVVLFEDHAGPGAERPQLRQVDGHAQVVDWNNEPIPGLYAAGNAMAAVLGNAYGGAGGTLGPGMTFGFIAGRHAATC